MLLHNNNLIEIYYLFKTIEKRMVHDVLKSSDYVIVGKVKMILL